MDRGPRLSIIDVVKSGTLDLRLASLLWLLMEHRASLIVAAGPSFAGKTTTMNVMLDFLRPEVKEIRLRGDYEDFAFLKGSEPAKTYLVAEEFSDHFAEYVWGDVARKAFELVSQGYAVAGTMHARTAQEALAILHQYLGLPLSLIGGIGAVVTLSVDYGGGGYDAEPARRIDTVSLVTLGDGGLVSLEVVASRDSKKGVAVLADERVLRRVLPAKLHMDYERIALEMEARERFLGGLLEEGRHSRDEVRKSILGFYQAAPS